MSRPVLFGARTTSGRSKGGILIGCVLFFFLVNDAVAYLPHLPEEYLPSGLAVRERTVDIQGDAISILEVADPAPEHDRWAQTPEKDTCGPFGGILWPGARCAASLLPSFGIKGASVVEIGAGTGLCSMAAAKLHQASKVLATDVSPTTLHLIEGAAAAQGLSHVIDTFRFDCFDSERATSMLLNKVDDVNLVIAADLLYNEPLTRAVARSCATLQHRTGAEVLVTDSQKWQQNTFLEELRNCYSGTREEKRISSLAFRPFRLGEVTGWSYADRGDATYEVVCHALRFGGEPE